jgi:hypothetical protein
MAREQLGMRSSWITILMRWASTQVVVEHEFVGNWQLVVHHCCPVWGMVGWDALMACEQGKAGLPLHSQ